MIITAVIVHMITHAHLFLLQLLDEFLEFTKLLFLFLALFGDIDFVHVYVLHGLGLWNEFDNFPDHGYFDLKLQQN